MFIKAKRKGLFCLALLGLIYLCIFLKDAVKVANNTIKTVQGKYRDKGGAVQCNLIKSDCDSNEFSFTIVGELTSKSIVLCSQGKNVGVVTIPNISTFFHMIEVPSTNFINQATGGDKEDANGVYFKLNTFIKSYGADNLFKLSDFVDSVAESSYVLVLACTGVEIPAQELNNEVERLFSSKIFSKVTPSNLYIAVYNKRSKKLVDEMTANMLNKLFRSFCFSNHTKKMITQSEIEAASSGKVLKSHKFSVDSIGGSYLNGVGHGRSCKVHDPNNEQPWADLTIDCENDHVPVNIYSTSTGDNFPEYCVNGQMITYKNGKKKIGRGLHLLVFSPQWEFISYEVYDTYDRKVDSDNLYTALMTIAPKSIVILATHDEASNKLNENVRGILFRFGSSAVARMRYRDSWVFIGQKGLRGKSVHEQLVTRKNGQDYAKPAVIQSCIPVELAVKPWVDTLNDNLALFCERQVMGYESVCSRNMTFVPITKAAPRDWDEFFDTCPLLVIPDLSRYQSHITLFRTLESISRQPYLRPESVYVALCKNDFILEFAEIVEIFGYNLLTFDYRKVQCFEVPHRDAFNRIFDNNSNFKQAIVIGSEVILHSDFMYYVYSVSPVLYNQNSDVISISAWNSNSFAGTFYPPESLLRVKEFPMYGWVLTRKLKNVLTADVFKQCCTDRKWYEGWSKPHPFENGVVVIPGLSRVSLFKVEEAYDIDTVKMMLYTNNRINSSLLPNPLDISFSLKNVELQSRYRSWLKSLFTPQCNRFTMTSHKDVIDFKSFVDRNIPALSSGSFYSGTSSKGVKAPPSKLNNTNTPNNKSPTCLVLNLKSLNNISYRNITKPLFNVLHMAHAEPFGLIDGFIFIYNQAIPVLLVDKTSDFSKLF